jgi:aryl-alcohol dehydrogenase-like predicted oxidoreductase
MRYIDVEGVRLSRIGLGTWQFGSREWGYGDEYASATAPALVRRAAELGITMLDTAEAYGPGRSERIIGETLPTLPDELRAPLVVATKFLPLAPAERIVAWQVDGSRRRLGMDAIDLPYVHWKNPFVSPRRVMQSVRPLVQRGVVRQAAVSNFSLDEWLEAESTLRAPIIANQVLFNLLAPTPARDLVPWAEANGRVVVAYSPLAQGLLTGRNERPDARFRRYSSSARGRRNAGIEPLLATIGEVAAAHGATAAQVALAWVLGHPNTIAIPGARTIAQLEENTAAAELDLSVEEMDRLSGLAWAVAGR